VTDALDQRQRATAGRPFELVAENRSRHFEHADDVKPVIRRRDPDPVGELSTANPDEIAQQLRARGAWPVDGTRGRRLRSGGPMSIVLGIERRWGVGGDAAALLDFGEDRDLRFRRGSLRRLQESGLVIVEPDLARGLLGLFGKGSDDLGSADFVSADAEVGSGHRSPSGDRDYRV
jgi:hypothetical protein